MNIKIADRLVKLRKEKGLSQEELADKLGISRQAVSKWERAEASPDTDNLICLAKLYGVSLDELLQDDDDIETIVKEQVKDNSEHEEVHIGKDGIHVKDKDSIVDISWKEGIHVVENGETKVNISKNHKPSKLLLIGSIVSGIYLLLAIIAMVVIGCLIKNGWNWSWTFILLTPVVGTIFECIQKKELVHFSYVLLVTFIYCFVCLAITPIWHPLWVVFITIPVYYIIAEAIDKYNKSKKDNDKIINIEND